MLTFFQLMISGVNKFKWIVVCVDVSFMHHWTGCGGCMFFTRLTSDGQHLIVVSPTRDFTFCCCPFCSCKFLSILMETKFPCQSLKCLHFFINIDLFRWDIKYQATLSDIFRIFWQILSQKLFHFIQWPQTSDTEADRDEEDK